MIMHHEILGFIKGMQDNFNILNQYNLPISGIRLHIIHLYPLTQNKNNIIQVLEQITIMHLMFYL